MAAYSRVLPRVLRRVLRAPTWGFAGVLERPRRSPGPSENRSPPGPPVILPSDGRPVTETAWNPTTRTIIFPDRWPVTIHLHEWSRLGTAHRRTGAPERAQEWDQRGHDTKPSATVYQIDVYQLDEQYVVAGTRTADDPLEGHNTGRLLDSRDTVVSAIRSVAAELSVDADLQRVLTQRVLADLPPEPVG